MDRKIAGYNIDCQQYQSVVVQYRTYFVHSFRIVPGIVPADLVLDLSAQFGKRVQASYLNGYSLSLLLLLDSLQKFFLQLVLLI